MHFDVKNENKENEVRNMIRKLASFYTRITDDRINSYTSEVSRYSIDSIRCACEQIRDTNSKFPSLAELKNVIRGHLKEDLKNTDCETCIGIGVIYHDNVIYKQRYKTRFVSRCLCLNGENFNSYNTVAQTTSFLKSNTDYTYDPNFSLQTD